MKRLTLLVVVIAALMSFTGLASASTKGGIKLTGPYNDLCLNTWQSNGPAVGTVSIQVNGSTMTVKGSARVAPYQTFTVWLVEVFLYPDGTIRGCSGSAIASTVSADGSGVVRFRGSVTRYPDEYNEQVVLGEPFGSHTGYATPVTSVTVP